MKTLILILLLLQMQSIDVALRLHPIIEYTGEYKVNEKIEVTLITGLDVNDIHWQNWEVGIDSVVIKDGYITFSKDGLWTPYYDEIALSKYAIFIN